MRLLPAYQESRDSVRVPFFDKLVELSEQRPDTGAMILRRDRAQRFLVGFMWLCLVIAAAKPQWIGPPIEQQKSGRDLMIAVDLSGSMETRDFTLPDGSTVDRLQAVKQVLEELADQHASDRLGLIVFGDAAYLQTPFTDDHQVWTQLLAETEIGMAGQSTVFGDAIGLAIKLFKESDSDNRVLIMLTDGNDTGSTVPPVDAAKVAAANDIRIYTIAVGDPASVGEEALDMDTIKRVSEVPVARISRHWTSRPCAAPTRPLANWNRSCTKPSASARGRACTGRPSAWRCCCIPCITAGYLASMRRAARAA